MPTPQQLPALASYASPNTRLDTPVPSYAATIWLSPDGEHFFLAVPTAEGGQQVQVPITEAGMKKLAQLLRVRQMPRASATGGATGLDLWKQQRVHHKKEHQQHKSNGCIFCKGEARDEKLAERRGLSPEGPKMKKLGTGPDTVIVRRVTPPGKNYSQQYSMEDLGL